VAGLAVLVVGALTVTSFVLAGARTGPADATGRPAPSTPEPTPPETAPQEIPLPASEDGGELRIVESGFSPITDVADEPLVTWGLVVENTSEQTAAAVDVSMDIVDDTGESLVTEISEYAKSREISLIMPGERAGIGDSTYVTGPGVADVTFELHDPLWLPVGNELYPVASLTASEIELSREEGGRVVPYWGEDGIAGYWADEGPLIIHFRVDSEYDYILDGPSAQAIFRNADGEVIGGTHPADSDVWATIPPGWSIQRMRVQYGPPAPADLERTEVYPYAGCC
jgi:hypothetical protein